jgi:hypothetical protein
MQKENSEQRYARWRQLVEEQNKRGLTQKIFCKQRILACLNLTIIRTNISLRNCSKLT